MTKKAKIECGKKFHDNQIFWRLNIKEQQQIYLDNSGILTCIVVNYNPAWTKHKEN